MCITNLLGLMSQSLHPLVDVFFEENVMNANGPVVVDFWDPRCSACRDTRSDVQRLKDHVPDHARIVSFDIRRYADLAHAVEVTRVPTLVVFQNGEVIARLKGAKKVRAFVDRVLHAAAPAPA